MAREKISEPDTAALAAPPRAERLPAVVPAPPAAPPPRRGRWRAALLLLLAASLGGAGAAYWLTHRAPPLPAGIAWSNGRLEADELDIATKFAGRIAQVFVDEGDVVKAGQVVARMDTRDLEASLAQAQSMIEQAEHSIAANQSELDQEASAIKLASAELERARTLAARGFQTREVLDQRQQAYDAAIAAYHATEARLRAATALRNATQHSAELIRVNIADNTLVAPRDGPIEYRLANTGEVLAAGGKVFTMLDAHYVYMDIFLPTAEAGRATLGTPARILLDAMPGAPIPAKIVFVASQNQFTPKMVETKSERDKLMFRVRVRVDADWLRAHPDQARAGLPGLAYLLLDPKTAWPAFLQAGAT
ncbi:MAG: efflux RND transporter periplasmic adaptor subunit [Alphaproteobacteria bacterium]|nr:efflux RND transporter periplasmic adaptor subunit [Alphaproteobacteria bacterium]